MKLASWLKAQQKTQAAFAEELGMSQPYVAQLCAGSKWPSRETVRRIQEVTRGMVSADDFIEHSNA